MDLLQIFDLSVIQWIWVMIAAIFVGMAKTAIGRFPILVVPILAAVFGGKDSTGILLPMLIVGDIFAVFYYNRHADWKQIRRLMPWVLLGIIIGALVGHWVNDKIFKILISVVVLICLGIMLLLSKKGDNLKVPEKVWFHLLTGTVCGFASMIGNAAGPIFSIYLLALGFRKQNFMGTNAWFFFLVNLVKLPLQVFLWQNINANNFFLTMGMIPFIIIGAVIGIVIIKKLNEKVFRYIIIAVTAIGAVRLLL